MSGYWEAWVKIAKAVAADPKVSVTCPVCGNAKLKIWDVPWEFDPQQWERHMTCPFCGATNSLRMHSELHEIKNS
jgi:C4-type Zn-finger protein